jgi:MFS family permease
MHPETQPSASIWDATNITLTTGSILAVTLAAFQGLAVATITPVMTRDLEGEHLYGWVFNAFLLPQIIATVVAGREVDRRPPWTVFYPSLVIFGIGCLVCGIADSMSMIFLGRALAGIGAGATFSTVYAIVGGAYEDRLRPSMLAAMSSAWVVPSLIGPFVAGFVADAFHWRYVFLMLLPILVIIMPLTWPSYRKVRLDFDPTMDQQNARRVPLAVLLAIGTLLFLVGPDIDELIGIFADATRSLPVWAGAVITIAGIVVIFPTLQRLLPSGTFSLRPMLGGAVGHRALSFGAFAVVETYLVYSLTSFGALTTSQAGLILSVGSLTWTAGSILQARQDRTHGATSRARRTIIGSSLMLLGAGLITLTILLAQDIWWPIAAIGFMAMGLGIGYGYTTSTSIAFANAPRGQDGLVSSSMLLGDLFTNSIGVGVGGFLLALTTRLGWSAPSSAGLSMSIGLLMIVAAALAGRRMVAAKS